MKLRKSLSLTLALSISFSFESSWSKNPDEFLPPTLSTPAEMAGYLGYLSQNVPGLFREATEYDIEFFSFLTGQNAIRAHLLSNSDYVSSLKESPNLVEIKIARVLEGKAKPPTATPSLDPIVETINDLQNANPLEVARDAAQKAIKYAIKLGSMNVLGAITGLLSLLPKEKSKVLFPLPMDQQVDELEKEIGLLESRISEFRFSDVGIKPMKAEKLIEELRSGNRYLRKTTESLLTFVVAGAVSHVGDSVRQSLPVAELAAKVKTLLFENGQFDAGVRQVESSIQDPIAAKVISTTAAGISKTIGKSIKSKEMKAEASNKEPILLLQESPGSLASLRGVIGVDCSTQFSGAYGYLPGERTFFINDEKGNQLGYVMMTNVHWNGANALYLHDISGPRITPAMTKYILWAIHKTLPQLGAKHLVLPTKEISHRNINFKHIRAVIDQIAAQGTNGAIEYTDSHVRSVLQTIRTVKIDHHFDTPEANPNGIKVEISDEPNLTVSTGTMKWKPFGSTALTEIQARLLALELDFPTWSTYSIDAFQAAMALTEAPGASNNVRTNAAVTVLTTIGERSGAAFLNSAKSLLQNTSRTTGAEFLEATKVFFHQYKIDLMEIVKNHPHLLYAGLMDSSDAPNWKGDLPRKLGFDALEWIITRRGQTALVAPVLQRHMDQLAQTSEFKTIIKELVKDREDSLQQLMTLIQHGLNPSTLTGSKSRVSNILAHSSNRAVRTIGEQLVNMIPDGPDQGVACESVILGNPQNRKER